MTNEEREAVAIFRYGLIAPILNEQCDRKTYLSETAAKRYNVPYYGIKEFSMSTIERWLSDYRKFGFDGLKPAARSDKGRSRAMVEELQEKVIEFRKNNMHLTVTAFYELSVKRGILDPQSVSYHSVYRLMSNHNLLRMNQSPSSVDRRRFAYDSVNSLWQGDMSVGPYLTLRSRKHKTYLFAFIDDCSRLIPWAEFFFSQTFDPMKSVLKEALVRRGVPKMLYVDNGKIYSTHTLHLACAKLGITLVHTKPYDPEAKGKIERFFGTVRRQFYPTLVNEPVESLDELNKRFQNWLDHEYHRRRHSSLNAAPLDVYMEQIESVRHISDPAALDHIFWHRITRKVRSDATVTIQKKLFQAPLRYAGTSVEVRFDSYPPKDVFIFENDICICKLTPVFLNDNAHMRRDRNVPENPVDFRDVFNKLGGDE